MFRDLTATVLDPNNPQNLDRKIWFQQDGPIEWPPRSPDLTPLDFFYGDMTIPDNLYDLKARIRHEMTGISSQSIENFVNQIYHRLGLSQIVNGEQFEQFL